VYDGFSLCLCARRLQQGHFVRPSTHRGERFELSMSQMHAFAVGPRTVLRVSWHLLAQSL